MDEEEARRWTIAGTADEVSAELGRIVNRYRDRDELHLVVRLHYPGMGLDTAARALELFANEVAPVLRAL